MGHTPKSRAKAFQKVKQRRSDFLEGKSCVKCGSIDRLEIDHIEPSEKEYGSEMWSLCDEKRKNELNKCQVLCNSCHREKTTQDVRKMINFGHGLTMYEQYGCRCEICRLAKSRKNAKRKR